MSRALGRVLAAVSSPRAVSIPLVGASLERVVTAGPTPDSVREPLARNLAAAWSEQGSAERAEHMLERAAARTSDPSASAMLAANAMTRALDRGALIPATEVRSTVERCLARADALYSAGDSRVTRLIAAGAGLTFHPQRHVSGHGSPFSTPAGVGDELAAYRESAAWAYLTRHTHGHAATSGFPEAPGRLVVLHDDDPRFIEATAQRWREAGIDVRVVGLRAAASAAGVDLPLRVGELLDARWNGPTTSEPWADLITTLVGDADLVWHEWAQRGAVLASLAVTSPLVVRAHSFELFTVFPHLIDAGSLSGAIAVSEPIAGLGSALVDRWHDLPWAIVSPEFDPAPLALPKLPDAARTLGMVGWAAPDKDARWTLDLLAQLRQHDPSWRLRLIGAAPDAARWPEYAAAVTTRLADDDVRGSVDLVGPTDDVAGELRHVGVGVSSSLRESYHLGLAEAAASGALPVVRNWPVLAAYGGAAAVWPSEWVVDDVGAATSRVLANIDRRLDDTGINHPNSDFYDDRHPKLGEILSPWPKGRLLPDR